LLADLFHHRLNEGFGAFHAGQDSFEVEGGLGGVTGGGAVDAVLADHDQGVGEQVQGYGEAAPLDTHHELVAFQLGALFVEYIHPLRVREEAGKGTRRGGVMMVQRGNMLPIESAAPTRATPTRSPEVWPALPQAAWSDTCATLQLWMQMVGKVRMALTPAINHCWNVTLYPTVRGLTTGPMPHGSLMVEIDFDFLEHLLVVETSEGERRTIPLKPMTVAAFYRELMAALVGLGAPVRIWKMPCEIAEPIAFDQDRLHQAYDAEFAQRFWRVVLQTARVFTLFRARFMGKVSPVHLFWGALDLACTRFSGRTAPEHPSMSGLPDRVTRDAYSHEVSSCGFWPGAPGIEPFFYSYAYPEPAGYREYAIAPAAASFNAAFGEFVLPYDQMRQSTDPDGALLEFLQSTYEAAANCAGWDRDALEVGSPRPHS